jgi:hypothetical protein
MSTRERLDAIIAGVRARHPDMPPMHVNVLATSNRKTGAPIGWLALLETASGMLVASGAGDTELDAIAALERECQP